MRIDPRTIRKKTNCTMEQAQKLAEEIRKLPKVSNLIMEHLDEVNLFDCDRVSIIRMYGYMDDSVKICGERFNKTKSFKCCGKEFKYYNKHLWTFDVNFPNSRFYEII